VVIDRPIEVIHWTSAAEPVSRHLRHVIRLGARAQASLLETYVGPGATGWTNLASVIEIGSGATLAHVKVQDEAAGAVHLAALRASLAARARYESFTLMLGGRLSRHEVEVRLAGEDAACGVNGAFLLRGQQEATIATLVDHMAPGGTTREIVKGVVEQRAHGIFHGRIRVREAAQRTDAFQLNKNLLLSTRAAIDTRPELEILADDVKCSHGATVGDLDETALFYLRSRGIEEYAARRMLIEAFAVDALDTVGDARLRAYLDRNIHRWLVAESGLSC
jgi:Fe-S cluster assembly protein SufD